MTTGNTGGMIRGLAAAAIGIGSLAGLTVPATAQPGPTTAPAAAVAAAVTGVVRVDSTGHIDRGHYKIAEAKCPVGKKVIGGSGMASGADKLALTQLEPSDNIDGSGTDGYRAVAAETSPGVAGDWELDAFALCADAASVPGWDINVRDTSSTTDPVKQQTVGCDDPSRQRVIGTGAMIGTAAGSEGQVVLQVARASASGDITRAQSHEDADGFLGAHWLRAYAVCMNEPQGYEVINVASERRLSESTKTALADCSSGKQVLSSGAATSALAPGHVSLQKIIRTDTNTVYATAVENTSTSQNWDFIVAQAICADSA